jgi:AbrB family looped-hinge helix DNA binding protein
MVANKEKKNDGACCDTRECCRVEAVVSVDARGQVVLPKEVRDIMGLAAGDKLALVTLTQDGKACCLMMMKAERLAKGAREFLSPILNDI